MMAMSLSPSISRNSVSNEVLRIEVIIANSSSDADSTIFDIVAHDDTTLQAIHDVIIATESLEDSSKNLIRYFDYYGDSETFQLDLNKSLKSLGIADGGRIIAEIGRKRRRINRFDEKGSDEVGSSGELLNLKCSTRIFAAEGIPLKEVRVLVRKKQICKYLMEDISALWNKSGLKFRFGRTTLVEHKTFEELGIDADATIVVTGGRN